MKYNNTDTDEKSLAYDLRQKYAELVGIHLEAVTLARISKDYPKYFDTLQDLYTVTSHKFNKVVLDTKEEDENGKTKEVKASKVYDKKIKDFIALANTYNTDYLGSTRNGEAISLIESSLRAIEMLFYHVLDEANVFGGKYDDDGL